MNKGIERAVKIAGSQSALAKLVGKRQGHIWWYLNCKSPLPVELAKAIAEKTGVPRHELRPDVWESPHAIAELQTIDSGTEDLPSAP